MQHLPSDKIGFASFTISGLTTAVGALSLQDWAAIIGIMGVIVTIIVKVWEARMKVKLKREEVNASKRAEEARAEHYEKKSDRENLG